MDIYTGLSVHLPSLYFSYYTQLQEADFKT